MTAQASRLILIIAAFVAGLVLCLGVVLLVAQRGSVPAPQASAVGGPFKLIDQNGRPVTEQDVKGKPFLVFFGFTHCPDVCPTTLFDISEVFRNLGPDADRAAALFVTVDPERDTPEAIKNYLSSFDPHLRGLTGDEAAVDGVIRAYRAYARKVQNPDGSYTMDHTALVYLMDKEGRFVAPFNLKRRPEDSAADLRRYF
ncbi:MAG TPA: SCO family protein [Xanthobacteraceae bacterium]|nr:SCO family protein [Xanthobacteraceae bacterium]